MLGVSVPQPEIEPEPLQQKQILNHWVTREVLGEEFSTGEEVSIALAQRTICGSLHKLLR